MITMLNNKHAVNATPSFEKKNNTKQNNKNNLKHQTHSLTHTEQQTCF